MPLRPNPLDAISDEIARWADELSTQMAEALTQGLAAPFAQPLSEKQKLEYYTAQFFKPDGTPNYAGRLAEAQRLDAGQFAETMAEVLKAHPEWKQPPEGSLSVPTSTPGVSEVLPPGQAPPETRPTHIPGVREVLG